MFTEGILHQALSQGGVCTTVSNFKSLGETLYPGLSVNLEDSVNYKDINLVVNNCKLLDSLGQLGNIKFYSMK